MYTIHVSGQGLGLTLSWPCHPFRLKVVTRAMLFQFLRPLVKTCQPLQESQAACQPVNYKDLCTSISVSGQKQNAHQKSIHDLL